MPTALNLRFFFRLATLMKRLISSSYCSRAAGTYISSIAAYIIFSYAKDIALATLKLNIQHSIAMLCCI